MPISYDSKLLLITPFSTYVGEIDCSSPKTVQYLKPQMKCSDVGFGGRYKKDTVVLGTFKAYSEKDSNSIFEFVFQKGNSKNLIHFGDHIYIRSLTSDLYISPPSINNTYYAASLQKKPTLFKITTPPGLPVLSRKVESGDYLALEDEKGNYLYFDNGLYQNTKGWVWLWDANQKQAIGTSFQLQSLSLLQGCGRPPADDYNMFHAGGTNYGDKNYGVIKSTCSSDPTTPDGHIRFKVKGKDAVCEYAPSSNEIVVPAVGCSAMDSCSSVFHNGRAHWLFASNWKKQTEDKTNRIACCGGIESSSDKCHPSYCPTSTNNFNVNEGKDGGSCPKVMLNGCTANDWTQQGSKIQRSCDSYLELAPRDKGRDVVVKAVSDFYSTNDPTKNHPFVRKAIDVCNEFPGACDETLQKVCSKYKVEDLEFSKYAGRTYDPNGTNLLDTCGCFLSTDQYYCTTDTGSFDPNCDSPGGVTKTCNTMCNFPNSIKPINKKTGEIDQCGGTTCVIDDVTVNKINSTGGSFSITQACQSSENKNPPYLCYLSDDINFNVEGGDPSTVQIKSDCQACFTFDPKDPSKPPIPIKCSTTPNPSSKTNSSKVVNKTILMTLLICFVVILSYLLLLM